MIVTRVKNDTFWKKIIHKTNFMAHRYAQKCCTLFTLSLNQLVLNKLSVNEKNLNLILSIK